MAAYRTTPNGNPGKDVSQYSHICTNEEMVAIISIMLYAQASATRIINGLLLCDESIFGQPSLS